MAKNCLVTKLKGSVSADLPVLSEIRFLVGEGASNDTEKFLALVPVTTGSAHAYEGTFHVHGSQDEITDTILNANVRNSLYGSGGAVIGIKDKYALDEIILGRLTYIKSIDDLKYAKDGMIITTTKIAANYSTNYIFKGGNIDNLADREDGSIKMQSYSNLNEAFVFINVDGHLINLKKFEPITNVSVYLDSYMKGDLSVFADFSDAWKQKLKVIHTGNTPNRTNIFGNIEAFSDYNFNSALLNNIAITGNLELTFGNHTDIGIISINMHSEPENIKGMLDALYTNGKTSGTLNIISLGTNKTITYNDITEDFVNGSTVTFSAGGWTYNKAQ